MNHREYIRELLKMSDEAIKKALCSNLFHRDLAEKYVNGTEFNIAYPHFIKNRHKYIEKPQTITITVEIPRPNSGDYPLDIGNKRLRFSSPYERQRFSVVLLAAIEEAMKK